MSAIFGVGPNLPRFAAAAADRSPAGVEKMSSSRFVGVFCGSRGRPCWACGLYAEYTSLGVERQRRRRPRSLLSVVARRDVVCALSWWWDEVNFRIPCGEAALLFAAAIRVEWRAGVGHFLYRFDPGEDALHNNSVFVAVTRVVFCPDRDAPLADVVDDFRPVRVDRAGGGVPVEVERIADCRSVFGLMGVVS